MFGLESMGTTCVCIAKGMLVWSGSGKVLDTICVVVSMQLKYIVL